MHDPKSVAHRINWPFKNKHGFYSPILTIWHSDPLNFRFPDGERKLGTRDDDSCGWFSPPYRESEWEEMKELARQMYRTIYEKQIAEREGKDYAYLCNEPETTYEIVYWIWRSIKAHGKKSWQFGNKRNFLSAAELEYIMQLATAPGDNFKHHKIKNERGFIEMFMLIWRSYLRYNRPWYKHPRWHIHHWSFQFHLIQKLKRRYWDKCSVCGKRGFKGAAYGNFNDDKIWHAECDKAIGHTVNNDPCSKSS